MSRATINPHPSHRMGIVDGEPCCVRKHHGDICGAAPWMPIIESECGASPTESRDTAERDDAIERMYTNGRTIRDIARELRVSNETISDVVRERCVPRKPSNRMAITPDALASAIARQSAGDALEAIAADMGVGYSQLRQRLLRHRKRN